MRRVDGIALAAADAVELVLWRHGVYRGNWIEPNFPGRHKLKLDVREEPDDTVTVTWPRPFPSGETVTVASGKRLDRARPPSASRPAGAPARAAREAARAAESFASEYVWVNAAHCRP